MVFWMPGWRKNLNKILELDGGFFDTLPIRQEEALESRRAQVDLRTGARFIYAEIIPCEIQM